jgi:TonB family protein
VTADAAPPPTASATACPSLAESQAYLAEVHDRAMAQWVTRAGDAGTVVIAFSIDPQGELVHSEVRSAPSADMGDGALRALAAGSPYPPIPEPAKCLAGRRLVATFRFEGLPVDSALANSAAFERFRWIERLSLAAMLALGLGFAAWLSRRGEQSEDETALAEHGIARLAPGESETFFRSTSWQVLSVVGLLHGTLIFSHGATAIALVALADLLVAVEIVHGRRVPLVRVSAAEIEIDSSSFSPTRCVSTTEISSWATTRTMLGLRTARGDLVRVPLLPLREKDQRQLLALVRGLPRAPSPDPPLTAADLGRQQRWWAFVAIAFAIAASAILMELFWFWAQR